MQPSFVGGCNLLTKMHGGLLYMFLEHAIGVPTVIPWFFTCQPSKT
jgi:hypothetical protein